MLRGRKTNALQVKFFTAPWEVDKQILLLHPSNVWTSGMRFFVNSNFEFESPHLSRIFRG
jgi:hypothetical protein